MRNCNGNDSFPRVLKLDMNAELCKLQGNSYFWKEEKWKCGFVTDGDTVKDVFFFGVFFFLA